MVAPPAFARAGSTRRSNAGLDENRCAINLHFQVSWVYSGQKTLREKLKKAGFE